MPESKKMNPVYADLNDLLSLKKRAISPLKQTHQTAYIGVGDMKSPFKTKGLDFQEVRAYQAGDDIRLIDWRVTAKYGKPFTKLYTDEKERQVYFICDMRSGMKFATQGVFKSVLTARITAFLTFMAQNRQDKIGYTIICSDKTLIGQLTNNTNDVLSFLQKLETASQPDMIQPDIISLENAFRLSDKHIKSGSIVFILSDFTDWNEKCEHLLGRWNQKSTCAIIYIYDQTEENLPPDMLPVSNGTDIVFLNTQTSSFQTAFKSYVTQHKHQLEQAIQTYKLGYIPIRTDTNAIDLIETYCRGNPS